MLWNVWTILLTNAVLFQESFFNFNYLIVGYVLIIDRKLPSQLSYIFCLILGEKSCNFLVRKVAFFLIFFSLFLVRKLLEIYKSGRNQSCQCNSSLTSAASFWCKHYRCCCCCCRCCCCKCFLKSSKSFAEPPQTHNINACKRQIRWFYMSSVSC